MSFAIKRKLTSASRVGGTVLWKRCRAQSTVEAAFALPLVFSLMLLLIQPSIVLYDRMVMKAAASEACRLLTTAGDEELAGHAEEYVRRRLAAIPQVPWFHWHEGACSYDIQLTGDEASETVSVSITNELQPLPLLDLTATVLGLLNGAGHWEINVSESLPTQSSWVFEAAGGSPASQVGAWIND